MDVGPPLCVAKGGTLYWPVTVAFGTNGCVASSVPVSGCLPDALGSSLTCTMQLREVELSPCGCRAVAEFHSW